MRRDYIETPPGLRLIGVILGLLLAGCGAENDLPTLRTDVEFRSDGTLSFLTLSGDTVTTIDIEIAETDEARTRGLMGRRSLPAQSGMFFIMDEVDTTGFWMRNTPLPLDILFVAPDSQIINISKRTTPFSEAVIRPDAPKKYVVEVRAGFTDRRGITDGMRVDWTRTQTPVR
jgi:hypothetical protein